MNDAAARTIDTGTRRRPNPRTPMSRRGRTETISWPATSAKESLVVQVLATARSRTVTTNNPPKVAPA